MRKSAMLENKTNKQKNNNNKKKFFVFRMVRAYKNIVQTRPDTTFA